MKKVTTALALVIGLLPFTTYATAIYPPGDRSCGWWIEERKDEGSWPAATTLAWVSGFVSGAIFATDTLKDIDGFRITDVPSMGAFVDKWCKENPLENVSGASLELVMELMKRDEQ